MRMMVLGVIAALSFAVDAVANQCYRRDYTPEHLAKNPGQSIEMLQVLFITEGDFFAQAKAMFRDDPTIHQTDLICWTPEGAGDYTVTCGVECDGGRFTTVLDERDEILLKTQGFLIGADCGEEDLRWVRDENAEKTVFKLFRRPASSCYD